MKGNSFEQMLTHMRDLLWGCETKVKRLPWTGPNVSSGCGGGWCSGINQFSYSALAPAE